MRIDLNDRLDEIVAAMVAPHVTRLAEAVRDVAAIRAPNGKEWVTVEDERVRPTHRDAHGQEIPDNVPFILDKPDHRPGQETGMMPRSPDFSSGNRMGCRCQGVPIPLAVARSLNADPAVVEGATARARVWTAYPRAAESEAAQEGGGWLIGAAHDVAESRRG